MEKIKDFCIDPNLKKFEKLKDEEKDFFISTIKFALKKFNPKKIKNNEKIYDVILFGNKNPPTNCKRGVKSLLEAWDFIKLFKKDTIYLEIYDENNNVIILLLEKVNNVEMFIVIKGDERKELTEVQFFRYLLKYYSINTIKNIFIRISDTDYKYIFYHINQGIIFFQEIEYTYYFFTKKNLYELLENPNEMKKLTKYNSYRNTRYPLNEDLVTYEVLEDNEILYIFINYIVIKDKKIIIPNLTYIDKVIVKKNYIYILHDNTITKYNIKKEEFKIIFNSTNEYADYQDFNFNNEFLYLKKTLIGNNLKFFYLETFNIKEQTSFDISFSKIEKILCSPNCEVLVYSLHDIFLQKLERNPHSSKTPLNLKSYQNIPKFEIIDYKKLQMSKEENENLVEMTINNDEVFLVTNKNLYILINFDSGNFESENKVYLQKIVSLDFDFCKFSKDGENLLFLKLETQKLYVYKIKEKKLVKLKTKYIEFPEKYFFDRFLFAYNDNEILYVDKIGKILNLKF